MRLCWADRHASARPRPNWPHCQHTAIHTAAESPPDRKPSLVVCSHRNRTWRFDCRLGSCTEEDRWVAHQSYCALIQGPNGSRRSCSCDCDGQHFDCEEEGRHRVRAASHCLPRLAAGRVSVCDVRCGEECCEGLVPFACLGLVDTPSRCGPDNENQQKGEPVGVKTTTSGDLKEIS